MNSSRRISQSFGLLLLAAAVGGCQPGHGKHTTEFKEQAQQRMQNVKAATNWDMAQQQFLAGDLDKALKSVDQSIALNEKVARSHILRGRILIEQGRLEGAMSSFDQAIAIEPANADAYYYKGIVYERFTLFDDAVSAYRQAAENDPSNPQFPLAAAEMLIDLGRLDEAEEALNRNAASFQHNAGIRQTLGHIAMLRGRHDEAVKYFGEAALLAPGDPSILEDQARVLHTMGRFAEAESTLRMLMSANQSSQRRDLRHLQAKCLMELDKPVEARDVLVGLIADRSASNEPAIWIDLGNVALMLKDGFRLREAGQRLIAMAPNRSEGYLFMAMWQRDNGKPENAAKTLERCLTLNRDAAEPAILRGIILKDLGRIEESRASLAEAARRDPRNQNVQRLLASLPANASAGLAGASTGE